VSTYSPSGHFQRCPRRAIFLNYTHCVHTSQTGHLRLNDKIVIAGAGGFIGGAQVSLLCKQVRRNLRAVNVKPFDEWYQRFAM
jgi:hypothetical protein